MPRSDNAYITRSFIVGSKSRRIDSGDYSHEWYCYIRPAFSSLEFIQNVTFKLHDTFPDPIIIKENPFEIFSNGWGEFTINIKITFIDPNERVLNLQHYLVLHDGEEIDGFVVSERYEEIVFRSPTAIMAKYLIGQENKDEEFLKVEKEEEKLIDRALESLLAKFKE